jgi:hypothetical protein
MALVFWLAVIAVMLIVGIVMFALSTYEDPCVDLDGHWVDEHWCEGCIDDDGWALERLNEPV